MKADLKKNDAAKAVISPNNLLSAQVQGDSAPWTAASYQGIAGLLVFLLLSAAALWGMEFQTSVPHEVRSFLGSAPPVRLINIALVVYFSCALIQILPRTLEPHFRYKGWSHIAYLSGFYLFYFFAQALASNLQALFAIGIILLTFEIIALQLRRRRSTVASEE